MSRPRSIAAAGALSAALYLLFAYVPAGAGHTVEIFPWRPLGRWSVESPSGLVALYALILSGLFALYAFVHGRIEAPPAPESRRLRSLVYAGAAVMMLALIFLPSLLSKDVFDYMVHGRILALYRANPFAVPASAFGADEFFRAMGWPQYTAIYGPGWISACALLAWISPGSVAGSLLVYKLLFAGAHLAVGLVVGALLRGWGKPSLRGEMLWLWNPLVLLQTVGQAHNDGFLMLWALLGLLLIQRRSRVRSFYDEALGIVCLAISVLVKYVTGPLLLFAIASRGRARGGVAGLGRAVGLTAVAGFVGIAGYLPYAGGMDLLQFLRPYDHGAYQGSTLMVLHMALQKLLGEQGAAGERVGDLMLWTGTGLALLTVLAVLLLALRTRTEEDVPRHGLWLLFGYLLFVTALLRVSYGVWIVGLAVIVAPGLVRNAALIFSATVTALEIYWVYAIGSLGSGISLHREQALATLVAVGVPISYLLAGALRARGGRSGAGGSP